MAKTAEFCNHFMSEIEIEDNIALQKCPVCGKPVMPCSACLETGNTCDFHWLNDDEPKRGQCQFAEPH